MGCGHAPGSLGVWRYHGKSVAFELNCQQWSGRAGCLGLLGLIGGLFAVQILPGILADIEAGAGMLPHLGLAVAFGLLLWLGIRAWPCRTARSIADGTKFQEIRGTESPRPDSDFDDPDALRISALILLFQDVHPDVLREILDMDPERSRPSSPSWTVGS